MELIEGKDSPSEIIPKLQQIKEKLLDCCFMCWSPSLPRGNVVILDSGFCILNGIVELKKCGVYTSALIKKRKYWPKYIKGDAIRDCFNNKNVGDCDSWKGTMEEVPFHVYAMKEPDNVMSLMSMYGTNQCSSKETTREWVDGSGKQPKNQIQLS